MDLCTRTKRKKYLNVLINNKQSEVGYASPWNYEIYGGKLQKRDGKKGLERKIDGRKERRNFSREIPSSLRLFVFHPYSQLLAAAVASFCSISCARARACTVVCFYFTLPGLRPYDPPALELESKAEIARFVHDPCLLNAAKKKKNGYWHVIDSIQYSPQYTSNYCLETFSVKIDTRSNFNQFPSDTSIHLTRRKSEIL